MLPVLCRICYVASLTSSASVRNALTEHARRSEKYYLSFIRFLVLNCLGDPEPGMIEWCIKSPVGPPQMMGGDPNLEAQTTVHGTTTANKIPNV